MESRRQRPLGWTPFLRARRGLRSPRSHLPPEGLDSELEPMRDSRCPEPVHFQHHPCVPSMRSLSPNEAVCIATSASLRDKSRKPNTG